MFEKREEIVRATGTLSVLSWLDICFCKPISVMMLSRNYGQGETKQRVNSSTPKVQIEKCTKSTKWYVQMPW